MDNNDVDFGITRTSITDDEADTSNQALWTSQRDRKNSKGSSNDNNPQICRYGERCRYWKRGTCNKWHPSPYSESSNQDSSDETWTCKKCGTRNPGWRTRNCEKCKEKPSKTKSRGTKRESAQLAEQKKHVKALQKKNESYKKQMKAAQEGEVSISSLQRSLFASCHS